MKILVLLIFLSSCAQWYPTNRSDYTLVKQDGFLISNIYVNPTDLDVNKKNIQFAYNVVIKNLEPVERKLNLRDSRITIGLRTLPIPCKTFEKGVVDVSLRPEETISIVCDVVLDKQEGMFQIGDYKSVIEIPLDNTVAKFAYLLRAEDFQ